MKINNNDNIFICDTIADGKSWVMQMEKNIGGPIFPLIFSANIFLSTIKILKLMYYQFLN